MEQMKENVNDRTTVLALDLIKELVTLEDEEVKEVLEEIRNNCKNRGGVLRDSMIDTFKKFMILRTKLRVENKNALHNTDQSTYKAKQ
ncbi:MAG: hypothetical protein PHD56_12465 [Anaerostipes sp.]|nr:hypothetical protein [Anaerostipes sp.]